MSSHGQTGGCTPFPAAHASDNVPPSVRSPEAWAPVGMYATLAVCRVPFSTSFTAPNVKRMSPIHRRLSVPTSKLDMRPM
eukprot:CAMPEP_0119153084 /NCGR_PEP_ID=MMETSP1310-20130426/48709_1 /TAXON_ID=464262 /ORGANISM="Genus nov. species nov., Strain RCC2339" /LENGTH=79 /DNA_ID=CAMNT_0007145505 /DNA_START=385 /DNA_END=624 /DNA_ORIENTATION=+